MGKPYVFRYSAPASEPKPKPAKGDPKTKALKKSSSLKEAQSNLTEVIGIQNLKSSTFTSFGSNNNKTPSVTSRPL